MVTESNQAIQVDRLPGEVADLQVQLNAPKYVQADSKTATLKAKFIYDGKQPAPIPVQGKNRDPFCAALPLMHNPILLGKGGALKNVAVYIYERGTDIELPITPVDEKAQIVLDNKGCMFEPPVLKIRAGQTLTVKNSDDCGHNAKIGFLNNKGENPLVAANASVDIAVKLGEPAPIEVSCSIHPWMKAHVIVTEHSFVGISDDKGELTIEDLPVGKVTFKVWHQAQKKSLDEVSVNGKAEKWRRGRVEIDLKPGINDLGTIKLSPELFEIE